METNQQQQPTRSCEYCKEQVHPEAIKCKHCGSRLESEKPLHDGTCPYCKEEIDPEAIKCKHCKSLLVETATNPPGGTGVNCGCEGTPSDGPMVEAMLAGPLGGGLRPTLEGNAGFAGFTIRCFYYGPFFGRWCCLYQSGRLISCSEMR